MVKYNYENMNSVNKPPHELFDPSQHKTPKPSRIMILQQNICDIIYYNY